jgi:hypothetical protein
MVISPSSGRKKQKKHVGEEMARARKKFIHLIMEAQEDV